MSHLSGCGPANQGQELAAAQQAVLAVPTADASRFRVIEVIKGERPSSSTIEGGYPRSGPAADATAPKGKPLLLVRDGSVPGLGHPRRDRRRAVGLAAQARRGKARRGHERGGLAGPRRARASLSREFRAAGGRARLRRARRRAVCRDADGEAAARRTRRSRVAGGPAARRATAALPAAAGVRRQRERRRRPRAAPGSGMEIGRCDEPGLDAGRGPGAARRGAHAMGRREISARPLALGARDHGGAARAFRAWQRERRDPARAGDPVLPGVHEGAPGDRRIRGARTLRPGSTGTRCRSTSR